MRVTSAIALLSLASTASVARPSFAHPAPGPAWIAAQLVPSPELAFDRNGSSFGLRWQLTPLSWSFGLHRRAPSRTRLFVVEPTLRHSGSIELWASPEWLPSRPGARVVGRGGLRSYFPILDRGEALSISVATSIYLDGRRIGPNLEVGVWTLFGLFGLQLSHAPGLARAEWTATLAVRVL